MTAGRALSDTFTGIRLTYVPRFVIAQCVAELAATALAAWLFRER